MDDPKPDDKKILLFSNDWLNDSIMTATQTVISKTKKSQTVNGM